MGTEQEKIDEDVRQLRKLTTVFEDATKQIGQMAQDHEVYGTLKKGKYEVRKDSQASVDKDKVKAYTEIEENTDDDKVSVDGYYNTSKVDMRAYANMAVSAMENASSNSDASRGKRIMQRRLDTIGFSGIANTVARQDLKSKISNMDSSAAVSILEDRAKKIHQNTVTKQFAVAATDKAYVFNQNDVTPEAWARTDAVLTSQKIRTNLSEGDIISALHSGKIDGIRIDGSIERTLRERQYQLRMADVPKVQYKSGENMNYRNVVSDIQHNQQLINSYLDSVGINGNRLSNREIRQILKTGKINIAGSNSASVAIDDKTRTMLEEKLQMNKLQGLAQTSRRAPGFAGTITKSITQEGIQGTDGDAGIHNIQMLAIGTKLTGTVTRGLTGATAMAAAKSAELAARGTIKAAKLGTNVGIGAYNLSQKVFVGGNTADANLVKSQKLRMDVMSKFDSADSKVKVLGHSATSKSAWFMKTNSKQKVRYVAGNIKKSASKWSVVQKASDKIKDTKAVIRDTKAGRISASIVKKYDNTRKKMNSIANAITRHTKLLRAPFTAVNAVKRAVQKVVLLAGGGFLILCLSVIAILTPLMGIASIMPNIFMADDSYSVTDNVGQKAVASLLSVQQNYLREIENYMDSTCTDPDHGHHTAYFALYYGDINDFYESISSSIPSSRCSLTTGESRPYDISMLYRTMIAMATVATGNETEDDQFYTKYCENLLGKILHNATFVDSDGIVAVRVCDAGLTNGMRLDPQSFSCTLDPGCKTFFETADDGWMHNYGKDSIEYSEWYRKSENYNTWDGWIQSDQSNFEWAQCLFEMSDDDWAAMGIEIPGSVSSGTSGGKPMTQEELDTVLQGSETELSDSDSPKRKDAIEKALAEFNRFHIYSLVGKRTYGPGEDLAEQLDCSSFVLGVMQTTGVVAANSGGYTETCKGLPDETALRPGDILLKYNPGHNVSEGNGNYNHVMLYLGLNSNGKPQTIECGGGYSSLNTKSNGSISIKTYSTVQEMISKRGITYIKNPYGD